MIQFAIVSLEEDTGFSQGLFRIRFLEPLWNAAALASIIFFVQSNYIILHSSTVLCPLTCCVGRGCSRVGGGGGCEPQMYNRGKEEWVELVYFPLSSAAGCLPAMDLEWLLEFHSSCQWMKQSMFPSYCPLPLNCHLQALDNSNKQINKNQNRTGGCGAINEGNYVLYFLAMEASKQGVM